MSGIFAGCSFYFGRPPAASPTRLSVLKDLIAKHGGSVATRKHQSTHVISATALKADYISDCIEAGKLLPTEKADPRTTDLQPKEDSKSVRMAKKGYYCFLRAPLEGPNDALAKELDVIREGRYLEGDARSELTYSRAVTAVKTLDYKIDSSTDLRAIVGIGPKIRGMLQEFLECGQIAEADRIRHDDRTQRLRQMCDVYGVGPATASLWIRNDYRDISQVPLFEMTQLQRLGVKYATDFAVLLPRSESAEIIAFIQKLLPSDHRVLPTGGYRRGKPLSHDLDLLIEVANSVERAKESLMHKLRDAGVVKDVLTTTTSKNRQDELNVVLLAFCLPQYKTTRRVDLIFCPARLMPFAMLGWTGSRQYERNLRWFCKRELNLHLTSYGLFKADGKTPVAGFEPASEEDILAYLGVPFLSPSDRNH